MAQVTLPAGVESISGRLGNVCFRTMKATGKTYISGLPSKRATELKPSEIEARERFARKAHLVKAMRQEGSKLTQKELWKIAAQVIDGKQKY